MGTTSTLDRIEEICQALVDDETTVAAAVAEIENLIAKQIEGVLHDEAQDARE